MSNINWGLAVAELANAAGASFKHNEEEGFTEWTKGTAPSKKEIDDEIIRLQSDYDAKKYQRDRAAEYPRIGDQLDMLYHAIDAEKVNKTSDFYKVLKAVKDKYPKG